MLSFLSFVVGFLCVWCAYLVYSLDKLDKKLGNVIEDVSRLLAQLLVADLNLSDRLKVLEGNNTPKTDSNPPNFNSEAL